MTSLLANREPEVDARQRAEKLLSDAQRRTDEFLATLGHEMRNPLSALSNALQVWPTDDPALMEELRGIMLRQVRQLTHLSDDLLDVARIAQGKLELRREQIGLRELIEGACEEVRPFIDRRGHALTIKLPHEPITIHGDPSRLLQVFANLIQNAAKFTGRNGRLTVTVEAHEGLAVVRVHDDGPGIELDLLPLLFEVVPPVDKPRAPGNDGLGIGLRLVKTIVELHGGAVAAHSEGPGRGSEFTVQLPASVGGPRGRLTATGQSEATHDGNTRRLPAHRILVVDDDRSSTLLLAHLLRSLGQSVEVASDGETAIRMVLEGRPRIVFLDIRMADMDGCEVARQLRERPELAGLVLIALSGNADEASRRKALDAGFDEYLVKPTSIAVLTRTLADIPAAPPLT